MIHPRHSFTEFKKEDIEKSVPDRFRQQVERYPERLAVKAGNSQLTYEQLNGLSNQIAAAIAARGGRQEKPIALLFEPGAMAIAAIVGALKAGKIWVPLDRSLPRVRLKYMLEDSEATLIVTNNENFSVAAELVQNSSQLINLDETLGSYSGEEKDYSVSADKIAYILYTSGSTGQPKGVVHNHRNILHAIRLHTNTFCLNSEDRLSLLSTYSHVSGLTAIFRALLNGAAVVSFNLKEEGVARLADWLIEESITIYHSVPTVFRHLIHTLTGQEEFSHLRLIHLGGEPVSARDIELYKKYFSDNCILLNNLGSTEAPTCRQYSIDKKTQIASNIVPVGYPIEDKEILLLDEKGNEVGGDRVGEIAVKTRYCALGYWQKPELTREKFSQTSPDDGTRIYRTGDLGRLLPDGCLVYLGRQDSQVKVRGYRIEIAEIEMALLQHPEIKETGVVAHDDRWGDKSLVAYLVLHRRQGKAVEDVSVSPEELREFLEAKLPQYMVPSTFIFLEALPQTPSGKIDRLALPAPDPSASQAGGAGVAPRTPSEEILANIWSEVLKIDSIGIYDNFFALGGHSLLATQVLSRVRQIFSVELSLNQVFESPTIAQLAAGVETARQRGAKPQVPPIPLASREEDLPLSFAQQRLWFLDQLEGSSATYNISKALRLRGKLDFRALEKALQAILERHEVLRTRFENREGVPLQHLAPQLPFSLPAINLQELTPEEQVAKVQQLARKPFDLGRDPLLRATLLQVREGEYFLLLVVHHIATDGWSMGILTRELSALYQAFSRGQASPLRELPLQYADYAAWQRHWLAGGAFDRQLAYWQQQLAGMPELLELPADRPRPPLQTFAGASQAFPLSPSLTEALKSLSQGEGVTLFMTLLAAFQILLCRYSSQEDIAVGSPIAGRNRPEVEESIGFFANTLVLRTSLAGNPTFRELLGRVREVTLGAYEHQDIPFEKLVEELRPERHLSHSPLFQVMFVLQNAPQSRWDLPELTVEPLRTDTGTSKFDITLSIRETDSGLTGTWEYRTDLFEAETIARMAGHFQTLLEGIVADPQQRVAQLPLLTEAERHQILVAWNDTQGDYPRDKCLHQLFEEQVERTPNAVAVVFEDQQLSYRELNRRANQLAHYLQKLGVGPEVLVGICLERSLEMVVGLLGILKAGGAYLPLDPNYPRERLAFMLEDAQVPVLLTQQSLLERLPNTTAHLASWEREAPLISREPEGNVRSKVGPTHLIYTLYTSGSTGRPKGVAIQHQSTVNFVRWALETFSREERAAILASTSICFDLSVFELFVPLVGGNRVILAENALQLTALAAAQQVTCINTVPSAMAALLRVKDIPDSVRTVNLAGEPLSQQLVAQLYQQGPLEQVFNLYGPSEATTYATYERVKGDADRAPSIGRPIANTQVYLLDAHRQPVPIGVPGELYVGGDGLARGYLNRPELTAEKFIPHPFTPESGSREGARLYRTGDLARYLPDGQIEFLGRIDHQVKIRGFRLELGEIESVLGQHPAVREAVAAVREDVPGDRRLVAYVVPSDNSSFDPKELRHFLQQKLPEYSIPSFFVELEALPLTANGKIDRRSLPVPDSVRQVPAVNFVPPRDRLESQLVQIWEKVLGVEPIGIHDNFFDLGGHSLLTVRLVAEIEKALNQKLPIAALFQLTTVEQVAAALRQQPEVEPESDSLPSEGTVPELPLADYRALLTTHAHWRSPRLGSKSLILETQAGNPRTKLPILAVGGMGEMHHHLPPDQPVYSLPIHTHIQTPSLYIRAVAGCYVDEILRVQPQGPYLLFGYCFGATVALEIAQQLQARGKEVALLALAERAGFDSLYEVYLKTLRPFVANWRQLLKLNLEGQKNYVFQKTRNLVKKAALKFQKSAKISSSSPAHSPATPNYEVQFSQSIKLAQRHYKTQSYQGQVLLFFSHEGARTCWLFPRGGWGKALEGQGEVHVIPGNTTGLLIEPNVRIMAEKLTCYIERLPVRRQE